MIRTRAAQLRRLNPKIRLLCGISLHTELSSIRWILLETRPSPRQAPTEPRDREHKAPFLTVRHSLTIPALVKARLVLANRIFFSSNKNRRPSGQPKQTTEAGEASRLRLAMAQRQEPEEAALVW